MIPVIKKDGCVRICGDYKVTVIRIKATPLQKIEELFDAVGGTWQEFFKSGQISCIYISLIATRQSITRVCN